MNRSDLRRAFAARQLAPPELLDVTPSTNPVARARALAGAPHGTTILALAQTEGRGRLGRRWIAPPGTALTLSIVLRPDLPFARLPIVMLASGVALARGCGAPCRLKWPNDLVAPDRRKIGGILAEAEASQGRVAFVIVGMGVNVSAAPADLPATHLAEVLGRTPDRATLAAAIVRELLDQLATAIDDPASVHQAWLALDATLGRRVRIGEIEGEAVALGPDGSLEVRDDWGGSHRIHAGDVQMIS